MNKKIMFVGGAASLLVLYFAASKNDADKSDRALTLEVGASILAIGTTLYSIIKK